MSFHGFHGLQDGLVEMMVPDHRLLERLAGVVLLLFMTGCGHTTPRTYWREWSQPAPVIKPVEPTVAANVAQTDASDATAIPIPAESTPAPVTAAVTPPPEATPAATKGWGWDLWPGNWGQKELAATASTKTESAETPSPQEVESSLRRLRRSLLQEEATTGKASLANSIPEQIRVRVSHLMERSRDLIAKERVDEARTLAEMANHLAQESELEFSPEEERPVDLLARLAPEPSPVAPVSAEQNTASTVATVRANHAMTTASPGFADEPATSNPDALISAIDDAENIRPVLARRSVTAPRKLLPKTAVPDLPQDFSPVQIGDSLPAKPITIAVPASWPELEMIPPPLPASSRQDWKLFLLLGLGVLSIGGGVRVAWRGFRP